jgi:hypothetical protein
MKTLIILSTLLLFSSCAFHSGSIISTPNSSPVYSKDIAIGVSQTNKFLWMGGVSKDALIFEAKQNMIKNRYLEGAEEYNNISIDIKNSFFLGLVQTTKVTVIADVVAPKDSLTQSNYSELYLSKLTGSSFNDSLFAVGDSVIYNRENYGEIISFEGKKKDKARIKYTTKRGNQKSKTAKLNGLYCLKAEYNGLSLGDELYKCEIIGFGRDGLIVKSGDENLYFPYKQSNQGVQNKSSTEE